MSASVAAQCACCAGEMCCKSVCGFLGDCLGINLRQQVRLMHILLLLVPVILLLLALDPIRSVLESFSWIITCPKSSGGGLVCVGVSVIYRISMAEAGCFLFILICCMGKDKASQRINEECWCVKLAVVLVSFCIFFFVSNSFIKFYVTVSQIASVCFLLFFVIMLIDLCYSWGESWVRKYDEGFNEFKYYLLIVTLALYSGNIAAIYYQFKWFFASGCGANIGLIIGNIFQILAVTGLSISGIAANGSLLTSAGISSIVTYFNTVGLASGPNEQCNKVFVDISNTTKLVEWIVGGVLASAAFCYITFADNTNSTTTVGVAQAVAIKEQESEDEYDEEEYVDEKGEKQKRKVKKEKKEQLVTKAAEPPKEDELAPYKGNAIIVFHMIMLVSGCYIAMLLTNWGSTPIDSYSTDSYYRPNIFAYWVKIGTGFATSLLYIYTMVAPRLFPERQFGPQE